MDGVGIEQWNDLFVAAAGAAAALAGLIIVAMSVNVQVIISIPSMTSRAGATIALLVLTAVVSICALIPEQHHAVLGVEVVVASGATLVVVVDSAVRIMRFRAEASRTAGLVKGGVAIAPVVLFLIGGALLCAGAQAGLYWVAAGVVAVFIASVLNAWVLLVEILR